MLRGLMCGFVAGVGGLWCGALLLGVGFFLIGSFDRDSLEGSPPYWTDTPVALRAIQAWVFASIAAAAGLARWIAWWAVLPGRTEAKQAAAVVFVWLGVAAIGVPGTWPLDDPGRAAHGLRDLLAALPCVWLGAKFLPPWLSSKLPLRAADPLPA